MAVHWKGQRKARRVGRDQKAAETAATLLRAKLVAGDGGSLSSVVASPKPTAQVTFEAYARNWLTSYAEAVCKPNTVRFYRMNLERHIYPSIGSTAISAISRGDCKAIIAACRERERHASRKKSKAVEVDDRGSRPDAREGSRKLKARTIEGVCRTLSVVLSSAVDDGHLRANPAFRLGRYIQRKRHDPEAEMTALTVGEVTKLLDTSKEHYPREYPLFLTALRTGMRMGELIGLKWGDLDFDQRLVHVRRNRTAGEITTPKNGKTRRVDMSTKLCEELRALLTRRKEEKLANGWKEMPEWVFCTLEGTALDGDNLRHRVFYKVIAKAGMRRVRFHDLRHTFASMLIQNRESLAYVRDQLGHSSIQVTVDIYGHLVPGSNRQAVDRLDAQQSATPAQPSRATEESA